MTIPLVGTDAMFGPRINTLDVRLARNFKVGRVRAQPSLDLYNVLNASTTIVFNGTYGPNWQYANDILEGRLAKVTLKLDF